MQYILCDFVEMLVELNIVPVQLRELNAHLRVINLQDSHADLSFSGDAVLACGVQSKFDFVLLVINCWLHIHLASQMFNKSIFDQVWITS